MAYLRGYGDDGDGASPNVLIWNSTKYPGTCKPSDAYTLGVFKELQMQLNRVAQARSLAKIAVDGDIGPGTVSLANKAIGAPANCVAIAGAADGYTNQAKIMADNAGVPGSVSSPAPTRPSTLVNAATGVETLAPSTGIAASLTNAFSGMSPLGKALAIGIVGGLGYVLLVKPPKKGARHSSARRY